MIYNNYIINIFIIINDFIISFLLIEKYFKYFYV